MNILNIIDSTVLILNPVVFLIWHFRFREETQSFKKTILVSIFLFLSGSGVVIGLILLYYFRIYNITIGNTSFSEKFSIEYLTKWHKEKQ